MNKDNIIHYNTSSPILLAARKAKIQKAIEQEKLTREKLTEFMNASVHDSEYGIIPEGYSGITYLLFFIFAPWIAGVLFMLMYISKGDIEVFNPLNEAYLFIWMIGYEIIALFVLAIIAKKLIKYILS